MTFDTHQTDIPSFEIRFLHGDRHVYTTSCALDQIQGEPYDSGRIVEKGFSNLRAAVQDGKVSKVDYSAADVIDIDAPSGRKRHTERDALTILYDYRYLVRFRPERSSRIIVTMQGGFTDCVLNEVDATLDTIDDAAFARVLEIVDLLQMPRAKANLDYVDWIGDYGYYVKIGHAGQSESEMRTIFRGGPFSKTPRVVEELEEILPSVPSPPDPLLGR